jgi:hypothetical protein
MEMEVNVKVKMPVISTNHLWHDDFRSTLTRSCRTRQCTWDGDTNWRPIVRGHLLTNAGRDFYRRVENSARQSGRTLGDLFCPGQPVGRNITERNARDGQAQIDPYRRCPCASYSRVPFASLHQSSTTVSHQQNSPISFHQSAVDLLFPFDSRVLAVRLSYPVHRC